MFLHQIRVLLFEFLITGHERDWSLYVSNVQTFQLELFAKIVHGFLRFIILVKSSILDVWQSSK